MVVSVGSSVTHRVVERTSLCPERSTMFFDEFVLLDERVLMRTERFPCFVVSIDVDSSIGVLLRPSDVSSHKKDTIVTLCSIMGRLDATERANAVLTRLEIDARVARETQFPSFTHQESTTTTTTTTSTTSTTSTNNNKNNKNIKM